MDDPLADPLADVIARFVHGPPGIVKDCTDAVRAHIDAEVEAWAKVQYAGSLTTYRKLGAAAADESSYYYPPAIITPSAAAAVHPCELHAYHRPVVVITQHHHSKPVYLQKRLWGEVRFDADTWLCGTGHDAVHAWLAWMLGEGRKPDPIPGYETRRSALATYNWYMSLV